ncbi:MAG: NAD(P)-dependent oxidoreductase [Flavobacteriaceae bacterium]
MNIIHLDANHPLLVDQLESLGYNNFIDTESSKEEVEKKISTYDGVIIRSRFPIDKTFIDKAKNLKFIGRVGAGLETIDINYAKKKGIKLISAPEGNSNAVGEHTLGLLLGLLNKIRVADISVRNGKWLRESNRGIELEGKIIGLIGYGNMGKSFAQKLKGFDIEVLCYDIKNNIGDENAKQVTLNELKNSVEILSLHVPQTTDTIGMVNDSFISDFKNPFWLLNTARGNCVVTKDLVKALKEHKILGAGLDVLEFENSSFESLLLTKNISHEMDYLIKSNKVLLTPHIAGWTNESKMKLAKVIVEKIKEIYKN